ncbi:MAG: serine hydrolase domain-containing protein [Candidatus Baltobacteraceae bacterium]
MAKMPPLGVAAAVDYARKYDLHAILIAQDGSVVHEEYAGGYDAQKSHALYSGTKSFWGAAAAAAVDDGLLRFDERVSETIAEWGQDAGKSIVTIRDLLSMTAGVPFGGLGAGVPAYDAAIAKPLVADPGTVFTYGGISLQIFGALLARKLAAKKQTPLAYLQVRLFEPIGLQIANWRTLKDGTHTLPTGAFLTARNWAKFGALLAARGSWNTQQLISRAQLEECWKPGTINPRYGIGFWLHTLKNGRMIAYGSGAGKQALYICPEEQLAVVHFADSKSFNHERFLQQLLG